MAYQDQFYTVGTVTVTNGSTSVTGAGTGWETALIAGGVFYAGGGAYPIQSVSSETELTLAIPYIGVDAAGVNYAIDRQRAAAISNIAMNDRLAQIIREISIGNIEELNAIDLIANQVLGTDAAGNLALSAFTSAARVLLNLGGAAAADKLPYFTGNDAAGLTPLTALGRAFLALNSTNGNIPVMTGNGGVASRPMVGTVSQSGGVPTGAIVERGGSADFGYIRDASGLQICWRISAQYSDTSVAKGSIFGGNTIAFGAFPAAFVFLPSVTVFGTDNGGGGWAGMEVYHTTTSFGSYSIRNHKPLVGTSQIYAMAIGRWY